MSGLILVQTICKRRNKLFFSKKISQKYHQGVEKLDLDKFSHYIGPDLGPNSLQKLSADDTRRSRVQCVQMNKKK